MATPELSAATGYVELLKNVYLPGLNKQYERDLPLLNKTQKAIEGVELVGLNVILMCMTAPSTGIKQYTSLTASVTLPVANSAKADQMTIPLKKMYGAIEIPDILMRRMATNAAAAVRPLQNEMDSLKWTLKMVLGKQLHGTKTGALATVASFSNGTPDIVTVDTTRNLFAGMCIDFMRAGSDVTSAVSVYVLNVLSETTFSVGDSAGSPISGTPAGADIVTLEDSYNAGPNGLGTILDNTDTAFQGVDRTANYWLNCNVVQNNAGSGNATYKPKKMAQLLNAIRNRSGATVDALITNYDIATAIGWVLYPQRQFDNSKKIETFDTGILVDGISIFADNDSRANTVALIRWPSLVKGYNGALIEPLTDPNGGSMFTIALDATTHLKKDAWNAYFGNHFTLAARRTYDLGDLTEVLGVSNAGYGNTGGYVD